MNDRWIIENTPGLPATRTSLVADLAALGVEPGMVLLVHSSLRSLGWVCGGVVAVIEALQEALEPTGTLIMPSQSGDLTDPGEWRRPPVPEAWKGVLRAHTPAYDPQRTPTRGMGAVAEAFRTWPDVVRSGHPHVSFAAWGRHADRVCRGHTFDFGLGEQSPLARIYELDGWVLLLGVGHTSNTSIHLAEYRADWPGKREVANGAPLTVGDRRVWVANRDFDLSSDDFDEIGGAYAESTGGVRAGRMGAGTALLMRQRGLVDFAARWIAAHRGRSGDAAEVIRAARLADRAEWLRLRCTLWPDHDPIDLERELDQISQDERAATFVAEAADGKLVGMLEAALRDGAEGCRTHPVGFIEGWFVEPPFRGRGIGRRLAEAAETWARGRGCTEMASDTTPGYPESPRAHAAAGYDRAGTTLHFRKSL